MERKKERRRKELREGGREEGRIIFKPNYHSQQSPQNIVSFRVNPKGYKVRNQV